MRKTNTRWFTWVLWT